MGVIISLTGINVSTGAKDSPEIHDMDGDGFLNIENFEINTSPILSSGAGIGTGSGDNGSVIFYAKNIKSHAFDIDSYAGYMNYADLLRDNDYLVDDFDTDITPSVLLGHDVLVIPEPVVNFSISELNAIFDFVEEGGGLFLLSDYPLIQNQVVTGVSSHWGISSVSSHVIDPTDHHRFSSWPWIHEFSSHPIINGLTRFNLPATAFQIVDPSGPSMGVAWSDDDSWPSNVPVISATRDGYSQRVVVAGDGSFLTREHIILEGNTQLGMNIINWLAGVVPSDNQPPVADAGADQTVYECDIVQFDDSNSYSPEWAKREWSAKAYIPSPSWGGASTTLNYEIYYMGGIPCYPIVDPTMTFMKYNPATDTWFNLTDLPAPRTYLGAAATNNRIYAIGGSNGNESKDTIFEFDPSTNSWQTKSSMPVPLEAFGIATVNDRIYVIGGLSTFLSGTPCKSVFEYDPSNDTWMTKPDMPYERAHLACAVLEGRIYIIGGSSNGSTEAVEMYDPISETWTSKASMTNARSGLCTETLGGKIYAFGGTGKWGLPMNTTEMYDPIGDKWSPVSSMLEPRVYFGSGAVRNCIYAMGGSYGPLIVDIPKTTEELCIADGLEYNWDFDAGDGLWWETGATPDATGPTPNHIYGDDGIYVATLRVIDCHNLTDTDTCNITVLNVNPSVEIESASMEVEIGLRVAGRKFNDAGMTLSENEKIVGYVSIERTPGSPDNQMAWIPFKLELTRTYSATVTYTPEDPPNIGGNPVWIYIRFPNGSIQNIHHSFNVQQSKKRDSEHWNHVEPWEVDLNAHLVGWEYQLDYHITDPGSDDELLTFGYGSQNVEFAHLCNPSNPDPYPSPEVNPRDIHGTVELDYEGPGTLNLQVEDDDGGITSAAIMLG
jgi:N-acetylneuraminic acid mutarotase